MEGAGETGGRETRAELRAEAVSAHAAQRMEREGTLPVVDGGLAGPSAPVGVGGPSVQRRHGGLRSLLSQFGSSFIQPSDVTQQQGRLQLTITSSTPEPPALPLSPPASTSSPRQEAVQQQQHQHDGGGNPGAEDNLGAALAADAERHRLLAAGVDIRAVAGHMEKAAPFVFLLLLLFLWQASPLVKRPAAARARA